MGDVKASFSEILPWRPSAAKANGINHAAGLAIGALIRLKAQALGANLFPGGLHFDWRYSFQVFPSLLQADRFIARGKDSIMPYPNKAGRKDM